ncbi:YciI family protein [Cryobacterium sp. PAMC25264]|uniref:YciI family protein n=1 Tax=Cryobacterium sp. PAMC25264 TaxID=2861288 RepID=UPI001C625172|nr:YciI family protein [Cryobacterium sp. PAMC25264]QYF73984.1 YciI family protein [Cryobacterium sp. PAMC25264]
MNQPLTRLENNKPCGSINPTAVPSTLYLSGALESRLGRALIFCGITAIVGVAVGWLVTHLYDRTTSNPHTDQNHRRKIMTLYIATFTHPDKEGWAEHLDAHVQYLMKLLHDGKLRASGPLIGTEQKQAILVLVAQDRHEAEQIVADDPYDIHGQISDLTIVEWDPIFGSFNADSSRPDHRLTPDH